MMTRKLPSPAAIKDWRELYRAALFETDRRKLSSRIAEAERAVMRRTMELPKTLEGNSEETQALNKGLYALRALRTCLKLNTSEIDAA